MLLKQNAGKLLMAASLLITSWSGIASHTEAKELKHKPSPRVSEQDFSQYFTGYDGTFVMYDLNKDRYTVYNETKSHKRVSPNSTFKVPHALIGLQTGVLQDANTTFPWDGTEYPIPVWNQDQTLTQAIQNSTIWYFQKVAKRVGTPREKLFLQAFNYGNRDVSGGLMNFWLQSSLQISPREQVDFFKRFYTNRLPVAKTHIDTVKQIIKLEEKNGAVLSGKTGTGWKDAVINGVPINGNFVGYVEKDGNVYVFATNIEANDLATSGKAKEITLKILNDLGIYG